MAEPLTLPPDEFALVKRILGMLSAVRWDVVEALAAAQRESGESR